MPLEFQQFSRFITSYQSVHDGLVPYQIHQQFQEFFKNSQRNSDQEHLICCVQLKKPRTQQSSLKKTLPLTRSNFPTNRWVAETFRSTPTSSDQLAKLLRNTIAAQLSPAPRKKRKKKKKSETWLWDHLNKAAMKEERSTKVTEKRERYMLLQQ